MIELERLQTPCLLVDKEKMLRNTRKLVQRLESLGTKLRVHAKTCKSADLLRLCVGKSPITVSTLAEAEYFAANGFDDILYAVGITAQKLPRVLALARMGISLGIILDSLEAARQLVEFGAQNNATFSIWLEIDSDGHRCGMDPAGEEILVVAEYLAGHGQQLAGVLTHAGSAYDLPNPGSEAFATLAAMEKAMAILAASRLRKRGYGNLRVSVGSTPTAFFGTDFNGVDETRAGVFIFHDCVMAALGVCQPEEIALSVLTSVTGRRRSDDAIVVDAGWSALSSDRGAPGAFANYGHGLVCNQAGEILPGLRVCELNQEHGVIRAAPGAATPQMSVGTKLRILPAHACATANNFTVYNVLEGNKIIANWQRCQGW